MLRARYGYRLGVNDKMWNSTGCKVQDVEKDKIWKSTS